LIAAEPIYIKKTAAWVGCHLYYQCSS